MGKPQPRANKQSCLRYVRTQQHTRPALENKTNHLHFALVSFPQLDVHTRVCLGYAFEIRIQELEVKVDGIYNTQRLIMDRLTRLESSMLFGIPPSQSCFSSTIYQQLTLLPSILTCIINHHQLAPTNSNIDPWPQFHPAHINNNQRYQH